MSWALFYGRFVSLSARKYKSKHENSVILVLHAWLKLLLKTDEEISKLNCRSALDLEMISKVLETASVIMARSY